MIHLKAAILLCADVILIDFYLSVRGGALMSNSNIVEGATQRTPHAQGKPANSRCSFSVTNGK